MGHGVVGSGVAEILLTHKQKLFASIGEEIYIKKVLDLREFPDSPIADRFTKDFEEIINDLEIRIVVEVMGGLHPAYEFVKRCLKAGKSVVTSNKELVAAYGAELLEIARVENVNFLFEASVGGGIPIIRPMNQCLVANIVDEVAGILSADIEGHDACRKICILASMAFGKHVYPDMVHTEGITGITLEDVKYAEKFGCVIKLIGRVKKLKNGMIDIITAPMLVPFKSQLANIDNEFNGIMVRGDCTGDVVFYGKGAGKLPTASAVVADIVDCCTHLKQRRFLYWADGKGDNIINVNESEFAMYVRAKGKDVAVKAEALFGSIQSINTPGKRTAFTTGKMPYGEFIKKINKLSADGVEILSTIRIGDL